MRQITATKFAPILGMSIFSIGLTTFAFSTPSVAQVCNFWGCSAPGAGECTIHGCPAPAPQSAPQSSPNIIIIPVNTTPGANITPGANTTQNPTNNQSNPRQVAACIRDLHSFYYRKTSASDSQASELAQNACRSGAESSCIEENYTYYFKKTPASHTQAAQLAQDNCAPR